MGSLIFCLLIFTVKICPTSGEGCSTSCCTALGGTFVTNFVRAYCIAHMTKDYLKLSPGTLSSVGGLCVLRFTVTCCSWTPLCICWFLGLHPSHSFERCILGWTALEHLWCMHWTRICFHHGHGCFDWLHQQVLISLNKLPRLTKSFCASVFFMFCGYEH